MSSTPPRPTNITTQLAKERNREAAERTMASWIQNCVGIIAFGAGFDNIMSALHQTYPHRSSAFNLNMARLIGLTAIAIGIFLLILMLFAYRQEVSSLEEKDYLEKATRLLALGVLVNSITVYGLVTFIAAVFILPWQ